LKAVARARKDSEGWQLLGEGFVAAQDWESARRAFDKSLAMDGDNVSSLLNQVNVITQLSDEEEALPLMQRAYELRPDLISSVNGYGLALMRAGEKQRAREVFESGLSVAAPDVSVRE
jgi:cytochrome c-type biogenesis protein CcmH/NrfG